MRRQAELCFSFGRELPYICFGMYISNYIYRYSVCRDFVYSVIFGIYVSTGGYIVDYTSTPCVYVSPDLPSSSHT